MTATETAPQTSSLAAFCQAESIPLSTAATVGDVVNTLLGAENVRLLQLSQAVQDLLSAVALHTNDAANTVSYYTNPSSSPLPILTKANLTFSAEASRSPTLRVDGDGFSVSSGRIDIDWPQEHAPLALKTTLSLAFAGSSSTLTLSQQTNDAVRFDPVPFRAAFKLEPTAGAVAVDLLDSVVTVDWAAAVTNSPIDLKRFRTTSQISWELAASLTSDGFNNPANTKQVVSWTASAPSTSSQSDNQLFKTTSTVYVRVRAVLKIGTVRIEALGAVGSFSKPAPGANTLESGQTLAVLDFLSRSTDNGQFQATLALQSDKKLVLSHTTPHRSVSIWQPPSDIGDIVKATMLPNGTFALYDQKGKMCWSVPAKNSVVAGSSLVVQDDGNAVILGPDGHTSIWKTNVSKQLEKPDRLLVGEIMNIGESRVSPNGQYKFLFDTSDGRLRVVNLQKQNSEIWSNDSTTPPSQIKQAQVQADDNFVVYNTSNNGAWLTHTRRRESDGQGEMIIRDDGKVTLVSDNMILWSTDQSLMQSYVPLNLIHTPSGATRMERNQCLTTGQFLTSPNGKFRLTLQTDGFLVLSAPELPPDTVLWQEGKATGSETKLCFGSNPSQFVFYVPPNMNRIGDPLNRVRLDDKTYLAVGNDGNVFVNAPGRDGSEDTLWSSGTGFPMISGSNSNTLGQGQSMWLGQSLVSSNGLYKLSFSAEGLLSITNSGTQVFTRQTYKPKSPDHTDALVRMTVAGNASLQLVDKKGVVRWEEGSTATKGSGWIGLFLSDSGFAYLTRNTSDVAWISFVFYPLELPKLTNSTSGSSTMPMISANTLFPPQKIFSPSRNCHLDMQGDSGLVLYNERKSPTNVWSPPKSREFDPFDMGSLVLGTDGNLFVKRLSNPNSGPAWQAHIGASWNPETTLQVTDEGNVIVMQNGSERWRA